MFKNSKQNKNLMNGTASGCVSSISVGLKHVLIHTVDGEVKCFGDNIHDQCINSDQDM